MPGWVEEREVMKFEERVSQLRASPDGRTLACVDLLDQIRLVDLDSLSVTQQFEGDTGNGAGQVQLAFSPDGRFLASGASALRIWDVKTGALHFEKAGGLRAVAFSPDSRSLAMSLARCIEILDMGSLEVKQRIPIEDWPMRLAFSPDGSLLASTLKKSVCVIEFDHPELERKVSTNAQANCVCFHPTQPWLGYAAFSRKLGIWNYQTKKKQIQLEMPDKGAWNMGISPDGSLLVADTAHRLFTWDTGSGALLDVIERPSAWSLSMDFLPDGRLVLSDKDLVVVYRFSP